MRSIFRTAACIGLLATATITSKAQTVTLSGDIDYYRSLSNDTIYILQGFVYVKDGGILDIEEGTLIKGEKASKGSLIITRDGIILAEGTSGQPIVFTSDQPEGLRAAGDWGGVLILGNAPINAADINPTDAGNQAIIEGGVDNAAGDGQYGGTDPNDSRGGMQYVRIEYPGIAYLPGSEINGLTCGGVGDATILDHIQVSYSGDDAFEFFGGTVNAKYLVARATLDDDFDTDFGYSGKLQFIVSIREPNTADISGANGFESDNDASGSSNTPITSGIISNATIIGPLIDTADVINANYKRGMHLRRNTQLNIHNSVITGFPTGVMVDGTLCEGNADAGTLEVKNTFIAGMRHNYELAAGSTWDINAWFTAAANENQILPVAGDVLLNDPYDFLNPDLRPQDGSPVLGAASFSDDVFSGDAFFDQAVTYSGAFDGIYNWASCWTNWDPQNTDYSTPVSGTTTATEAYFDYDCSESPKYTIHFMNASAGADSYAWDFGVVDSTNDVSDEIDPTYTFPAAGSYDVTLIAIGCSADTINISVNVDSPCVAAIHEAEILSAIEYYPNPVSNILHLEMHAANSTQAEIFIRDITGKMISNSETKILMEGENAMEIDFSQLPEGLYFVSVLAGTEQRTIKIMVSK